MIKIKKIKYPKGRYSGESPWLEQSWLYEQYVEQDKSSKEIAEEFGCKPSTITTYVSRYGLKKKEKDIKDVLYKKYIIQQKPPSVIGSEIKKTTKQVKQLLVENGFEIRKHSSVAKVDSYNLEQLYIDEDKSINEISKITGSPRHVVRDRLVAKGIPIKTNSEIQIVNKDALEYLNNRQWLEDMYLKERKGSVEIAKLIDVNYSTVCRYLRKHGFEIRDNSESKIGVMVGDKHHNWKGGRSSLGQICRTYFRANLQEKVAKRDGWTCQICGKRHCVLHVHHIYPFKNILDDVIVLNPHLDPIDDKQELYDIIVNDVKFNDLDNLITLCKECHLFDVHKYEKRK